MFQQTPHNNQIPLDIINTFNKKKNKKQITTRESNKTGYHSLMLTKSLTVSQK